MSKKAPTKLGKYEVIMELARGSMGIVYLGFDSFIGRQVAIKVAKSETLQDKEFGPIYKKMFFNEAHTAGMLAHPNVLSVFDAGVDDDFLYIVMEYIEGGDTLRPYTKVDKLLPVPRVVEIIFKCAKALDYAHSKGVIHRDIKPSNILLTPDKDVKISDFSIAYMTNPDMTLTQPLGLVGSPMYMSPEQVQEDKLSPSTDLFSLGVVAYEMLTGKHPFSTDNLTRLIHKITNETPKPLRELRPDIPEPLERIVSRVMQKNARDRYPSGLEFAADLSLVFEHLEKSREAISAQERFNTVRKLRFFAEFEDPEIWGVLRAGLWQQFHPNTEILTEGDVDDAFYLIVEGEVGVSKGGKAIGSLRQGDCFGEMGYIAKAKRMASITAKTPVTLLKINSTLIDQTSPETQLRFHKVFLKTLIERLSRTNEKLSQVESAGRAETG